MGGDRLRDRRRRTRPKQDGDGDRANDEADNRGGNETRSHRPSMRQV
jgi:hypothetical protein